MSTELEKLAREAVHLPQCERLALARILLEMDERGTGQEAERAWDTEISERVQAVEEGLTEGIPYDQVLARVNKRLAR